LWPAVPDGTQPQAAQQIPQYLRQSSCRLALEHLVVHLPSQNPAGAQREAKKTRVSLPSQNSASQESTRSVRWSWRRLPYLIRPWRHGAREAPGGGRGGAPERPWPEASSCLAPELPLLSLCVSLQRLLLLLVVVLKVGWWPGFWCDFYRPILGFCSAAVWRNQGRVVGASRPAGGRLFDLGPRVAESSA
jgi:hypothetical protein